MKPLIVTALAFLAFGTSQQSFAQAGLAQPVLKAGAAKVDITPAENELPRNYEGILDHLYARAIVLDSGAASAALISLDAGAVPEQVWQQVTRQVETERRRIHTALPTSRPRVLFRRLWNL